MTDLRVVIVEDDARYRASLEALLGSSPGFALAAGFSDPDRALAWFATVEHAAFDVVIMSGIDATARLRARFPDVAVVMLAVFEEPLAIVAAICAGASGYLLKRTTARALLAQLSSIAGGGAPMTAGVARTVLELHLDHGRGQDVLRCLVRGLTYKQVADELSISLEAVRAHIRALYKKLQGLA